MELRHLRTFLAVADALHFGAASDRLFLSSSTVTEHIQALEREAGVLLFDRGRTVQLTEAGRVFVGHARQTLDGADAAMAALRDYSAGQEGQLRVGILSNGAGPLTPQIIRTYMAAHPKVRVAVQRLNFRDHLDAVTEHGIDVAFVRPPPDHQRVTAIRLTQEHRVAVLPSGHPMAEAARIPAQDVLEEPFVSLADDVPGTFLDYVHLRNLRNGLAARTVNTGCRDVIDVLAAVSAGRGIASAVESFRGYENWPGVAYVSLVGAPPSYNVLIHRRDDPSPLVSAFAAVAKAAVALPAVTSAPSVPALTRITS